MKGIKINELAKKIDAKKVWGLASIAVTIVGAVVSNKTQANERMALKAELKEEILKDLQPKD